MFPNLRAEQARRHMSDEKAAAALGMTRPTYAYKKKHGTFSAGECKALCSLFNCGFDYLFSEDGEEATA